MKDSVAFGSFDRSTARSIDSECILHVLLAMFTGITRCEWDIYIHEPLGFQFTHW